MREFYPKYSEIPKDVYEQVKAVLKGYERYKRERLNILHNTPQKAEGGRGSQPGNPTEQKAVKMAYFDEQIRAIDQAKMWMRGKLDGKVGYDFDPLEAFWSYSYFNSAHIRRAGHDHGPAERTWKRYRFRFAAIVAKNLNLF